MLAGRPAQAQHISLSVSVHSLLQSLSSMQQGRRRTFWLLAAKKCTVNKTAYHHMINLLHIYCSIIYNPAKLSYIFGFDQGDQIKIKYLTLQIRHGFTRHIYSWTTTTPTSSSSGLFFFRDQPPRHPDLSGPDYYLGQPSRDQDKHSWASFGLRKRS